MADDRVHAETVEQWHAWLLEHQAGSGVWLVSWKQRTDRPAMTYDEAVTEAIAFGWVDSKSGIVDDERGMRWFAPRKATSGWSRTNKARVEQLEREGRMQPRGRAAVEVARANGKWAMLDDVEDGVVPDDLAAAFTALPGSRATWEAFPRSVRRANLEWLVQAKQPATRARRIAEISATAARGERANQWRRDAGKELS